MHIHKKNKIGNYFSRTDDPLLIKSRKGSLIFEIIDLIENTRANGEKEILKYYFEKKIKREEIFVSREEIFNAKQLVEKNNIVTLQKFMLSAKKIAEIQKGFITNEEVIQKTGGFNALLSYRALDTIGMYIPRNLPSSLIYYSELAKKAGVRQIILALPPEEDGSVNPYLLVAASLVGIDKIIAVGGLRAFPSLAFGTAFNIIPDKIFGPSSFYVDLVKQALNTFYKVPVDLASGPTEIAVYIDSSVWIDQAVADLLAQLEHGSDSRCLVFTTDKQIFNQLNQKLIHLSQRNGEIFFATKPQEAFNAINSFSPEILEVFSEEPDLILPYIKNASNIYFNTSSPLGDYLVAGKGCADPTFGMSKGISGITLRSFLKTMCITTVDETKLDAEETKTAKNMAHIEGFENHKAAIENYELWKSQRVYKK